MNEVILCGSGLHSRAVLSLLQLLGFAVPYILVANPDSHYNSPSGIPIRGPLSLLPDRSDTFAFLAIEGNQQREDAAKRFKNVNWVTLIHPNAWVDPSARLGLGSYVAAGVVINAKAVAGDHVLVGTGASVGHDCIVEDFVQLESGVRLGGGARLGRGCLCGIGSSVVPNITVGNWTTLGPRAVVVKSVPPRSDFGGVPAQSLKQ